MNTGSSVLLKYSERPPTACVISASESNIHAYAELDLAGSLYKHFGFIVIRTPCTTFHKNMYSGFRLFSYVRKDKR